MKIKSTLLTLSALLMAGVSQAQDGWTWPADPAEEAKAREFNAAYNDYMNSDQFIEATKPLYWLLINAPVLNEAIYINGVTIYKAAADATTDAAQKSVYQDSVIALYNKRGELYDNTAKWIETKAYYGYQFYRGEADKLAIPIADFEKALELNATISPQLTAAYFDLVRRNYLQNKAYEPEQVLAIYDTMNGVLDKAAEAGKDVVGPKGQLEQLLVAMELIDCDFIENTMGPKLAANPTDEALADQIFKYSVQYKCYSSKAFLASLELIHAKNPTYSTSQVIGMRYLQEGSKEKAEPMFQQALTLAESNEQKAEMMMELAKMTASQGKKSQARSFARDAASLDNTLVKEAFSLIGNLYISSSNDCRGGESRAKDYSIYIAAYAAYQRAGDSKGMANAKSRFPSKEELFTEGLSTGASISTGCWIGETVTLATRD